MKFNQIKTADLIDSFPPNNPLYKDSGLWQVRSDDMEDVLFQQTANETFREFIVRYSESLQGDPVFVTELACKEIKLISNQLDEFYEQSDEPTIQGNQFYLRGFKDGIDRAKKQ